MYHSATEAFERLDMTIDDEGDDITQGAPPPQPSDRVWDTSQRDGTRWL